MYAFCKDLINKNKNVIKSSKNHSINWYSTKVLFQMRKKIMYSINGVKAIGYSFGNF